MDNALSRPITTHMGKIILLPALTFSNLDGPQNYHHFIHLKEFHSYTASHSSGSNNPKDKVHYLAKRNNPHIYIYIYIYPIRYANHFIHIQVNILHRDSPILLVIFHFHNIWTTQFGTGLGTSSYPYNLLHSHINLTIYSKASSKISVSR